MTFIRRTWHKYSKLGRGRKKKQVWRKPKGRDNKMRERKRGAPKVVKIGYGKESSEKKEIFVLQNIKDIEKIKSGKIVMVGNIGRKKKIEIAEELKKRNIKVQGMNIDKFLKSEASRKKKEIKKPESKEVKKSEKENPKKTEDKK